MWLNSEIFFRVWFPDNMKKIFVYNLLTVLIHNEIFSTFSFGKEYPHMEIYYSEQTTKKTPCDDIVCKKSELMVVQIELLLKSFNHELDIFSQERNVSNAYKLSWNKVLGQLAQNKSSKCLPPTYENGSKKYFLYDQQILNNFGGSPSTGITFEVVIGERTKAEAMDKESFFSNMVKAYTEIFFSSDDDLKSRASNRWMGCGYIYIEKDNFVSDRLLCIFGFMYLGKNPFTLLEGPPCTKCDTYYQIDLNSTSGMIVPKNTTWMCDLSSPYLCTDANLIPEPIDSGPYIPHCGEKIDGEGDIDKKKDEPVVTSLEDTEVSDLPCYPILIPLAILIIIFLVLAIYHFVTALKFHYKYG